MPYLVGCGAIFNGSSSRVPVDSEPQGVEVWVDDLSVGVTPLHVELANGEEHVVVFKRPGKSDQVVRVGKRLSGTYVVLDILFTGIVGIVVDAATGSWYTPDASDISVLEPRERAAAPAAATTGAKP